MPNTVFPQSESAKLDLRNGQVYQVFVVNHTTGTQSDLPVDQSAVNVCELSSSGTGLAKEATPSAGVSVGTAGASATGIKLVSIASGVASGTYTLVVRYSGSGAGIGSSK